ncbi:MAG TPA: triose-phosphate isomerase [Xanthobacteraceae bacterium]|nr:triose-phosphate isomerase [Xanthobacteraceae bacterium]
MTRRPLIAGNWKMNGLAAAASKLDRIIAGAAKLPAHIEVLVCPPFLLVPAFAARAHGSRVAVGGQDCHAKPSGAHTGDIAAEMLADAAASFVIVGHSERRQDHHETDAQVRAKALAARRAGLAAIVCVGETRAERDAGRAREIVAGQLDGSLPDGTEAMAIAYEPVWAIGTGLTPTPDDVCAMHGFIRERLVSRYGTAGESVRILYGGSVKPANAKELLAIDNVDGALIGGASLDPDEFLAIAGACPTVTRKSGF